MNFRRFFDYLQVRLHLRGMHRLAMFLGRWGTPVDLSIDIEFDDDDIHDRPTVPVPVFLGPAVLSGEGWSLVEVAEPGPLKAVDLDTAYEEGGSIIDVLRDVKYPNDRLDVN